MTEIPLIQIDGNVIREIRIDKPPGYLLEPRMALPPNVPVTEQIGVPIVDVPGCVEAHEVQENNMLEKDDPKGVKTFCDAGVPSFNPIDYNKDKLEFEHEPPVPPIKGTPDTTPEVTPEVPKNTVPTTPKQDCPTREQVLKNPIGKVLEGNKKIVDYELVGKECLMVTEQLSIPDQIVYNIPNAGMVTTTASIAVVATSSALLAKPVVDVLLKVVKPAVKKTIKKIQTALGKAPPKLSRSELQTNKYREKKGLSPLKFGKKKKK